MEHDRIGRLESWESHSNDDNLVGNRYIDKEEFLANFERRVKEDFPEFDRATLSAFRQFFNMWEKEFEETEQVSAQTAYKRLLRYLKE